MRRLGIRITNALLGVFCCYAAAGIFNQISASMLAPLDDSAGLAVAEVSSPAPRSATRTRDINERNLFGSALLDGPAVRIEPEVEIVTVITKLPLTLLGTAAFENDTELSLLLVVVEINEGACPTSRTLPKNLVSSVSSRGP